MKLLEFYAMQNGPLDVNVFVFDLVSTSTFKPTPEIPAFQFVGSIDRNGSAEKASLKEGDYLIEVSFY